MSRACSPPSQYVPVRGYYVRPHCRRRPRRRPVFEVDPITYRRVCRLLMEAMLHERRQGQHPIFAS